MAESLEVGILTRNNPLGILTHSSFFVKPPQSLLYLTQLSFETPAWGLNEDDELELMPVWDCNHVLFRARHFQPFLSCCGDTFPRDECVLVPSGVPLQWPDGQYELNFEFNNRDDVEELDHDFFTLPSVIFDDSNIQGKFVRGALWRMVHKCALGCYGPTQFNDNCKKVFFKANPLAVPAPEIGSYEVTPTNPAAFLSYFPWGIKDFIINPTTRGALRYLNSYTNYEGSSVRFSISEPQIFSTGSEDIYLYDLKFAIQTIRRFKKCGLNFTNEGVVGMSNPLKPFTFERIEAKGIMNEASKDVVACLMRNTPGVKGVTFSGHDGPIRNLVLESFNLTHVEKLKVIQLDHQSEGVANLYPFICHAPYELKKLYIVTSHCPQPGNVVDVLEAISITNNSEDPLESVVATFLWEPLRDICCTNNFQVDIVNDLRTKHEAELMAILSNAADLAPVGSFPEQPEAGTTADSTETTQK